MASEAEGSEPAMIEKSPKRSQLLVVLAIGIL